MKENVSEKQENVRLNSVNSKKKKKKKKDRKKNPT